MDLKGVLTEAELGQVGGDILAKLESAYRGELAAAIKEENRKSAAKFESLMEVVGKKVDEKVGEAVAASVGKQKADAINGKLFEALEQITAIVEQAGIPATEVTKKLKQELEIANKKLQDAYVDREDIKKKLNYQAKLNRIYELTAGCSPDIVNSVIERFKDEDIRAIDKNSIADFIDNNDSGDGVTMNIDADVVNIGSVGGNQEPMDGLMDKVEMALSEIKDNADMDMPGFLSSDIEDEKPKPVKRRMYGEAASRGFKPERVRIPATGSALVESQAETEPQEPDVAAAMKQIQGFQELGFGSRFI
jgi:hypothetical protein